MKKLVLVLAIILSLGMVFSYGSVTDKVLEYPFDSGCPVSDTSGNGFDGSCNTSISVVTGVSKSNGDWDYDDDGQAEALDFDGSNDYVDAGDIGNLGDSYSVSVWFRTDTVLGNNIINSYRTDNISGDTNIGWQLDHNDDNLRFIVRDDSGTTAQAATGTGFLQTGTLYHMVAVRNGDSLDLYVNSTLEAQDSASLGTIYMNRLGVGNLYNDNGDNWDNKHFDGVIDEYRVFNRDLTSTEVQNLYDFNSISESTASPSLQLESPADGASETSPVNHTFNLTYYASPDRAELRLNSSGLTLIDGFEDGDYTSDPAWTNPLGLVDGGSASVSSQNSVEGSNSLEINTDGQGDNNRYRIIQADLDPSQWDDGDNVSAWVKTENVNSKTIYGLSNQDSGEFVQLEIDNGNINAYQGSGTIVQAENNTWYRLEIVWNSDNNHTLNVYDSQNNLLGTGYKETTSSSFNQTDLEVYDNTGTSYSSFFDEVAYNMQEATWSTVKTKSSGFQNNSINGIEYSYNNPGTYDWNIDFYDTDGGSDSGTARTLDVNEQKPPAISLENPLDGATVEGEIGFNSTPICYGSECSSLSLYYNKSEEVPQESSFTVDDKGTGYDTIWNITEIFSLSATDDTNTQSQDFALIDVNNDGRKDLVTNVKGCPWFTAIDQNKSVIWENKVDCSSPNKPAYVGKFADFDADNTIEMLYGNRSKVWLVNTDDGSVQTEITVGSEALQAGNLTNDDKLHILVGDKSAGHVKAYWPNGTEYWSYTGHGQHEQRLGSGDTDGDGLDEVIGNDKSGNYFLLDSDGAEIWSKSSSISHVDMWFITDFDTGNTGNEIIGVLDDDNSVSGEGDEITVMDGNGNQLRSYEVSSGGPAYRVADIHPDYIGKEIAYGVEQTATVGLLSNDLNQIWTSSVPDEGESTSQLSLSDVDGDSYIEIMTNTDENYEASTYAFNYDGTSSYDWDSIGWNPAKEFSEIKGSNGGIGSRPGSGVSVGSDYDNDGLDEYMYHTMGIGSQPAELISVFEAGNFSGEETWKSRKTTNQVSNNSVNTIYDSLDTGTHLWNMEICQSGGLCSFADQNYTLTVSDSSPSITIHNPSEGGTYSSSEVDLNVTSSEAANFTYNNGAGNVTVDESDQDLNETLTGLSQGQYTVDVWATDSAGNTGHESVTYTVSTDPTASFSVNQTTLDIGETAEFDGSGSTDNGSITSYEWSFGDGSTDNGVATTHSYGSTGTYTVELTVTDDQGNTDTTSQSVSVVNKSATKTGAIQSCPAEPFCTNDTNPINEGTVAPGETIKANWTIKATGAAATYETFAIFESTNPYVETVDSQILNVSILGDGSAETNSPPSADFSVSLTDLTADVDASGSSDSDGSITDYEWDWTNDGTYEDTGVTASHTYPSEGEYTIKLRVTDDDGATSTLTKTVSVTESTDDGGGGDSGGDTGDDETTVTVDGSTASLLAPHRNARYYRETLDINKEESKTITINGQEVTFEVAQIDSTTTAEIVLDGSQSEWTEEEVREIRGIDVRLSDIIKTSSGGKVIFTLGQPDDLNNPQVFFNYNYTINESGSVELQVKEAGPGTEWNTVNTESVTQTVDNKYVNFTENFETGIYETRLRLNASGNSTISSLSGFYTGDAPEIRITNPESGKVFKRVANGDSGHEIPLQFRAETYNQTEFGLYYTDGTEFYFEGGNIEVDSDGSVVDSFIESVVNFAYLDRPLDPNLDYTTLFGLLEAPSDVIFTGSADVVVPDYGEYEGYVNASSNYSEDFKQWNATSIGVSVNLISTSVENISDSEVIDTFNPDDGEIARPPGSDENYTKDIDNSTFESPEWRLIEPNQNKDITASSLKDHTVDFSMIMGYSGDADIDKYIVVQNPDGENATKQLNPTTSNYDDISFNETEWSDNEWKQGNYTWWLNYQSNDSKIYSTYNKTNGEANFNIQRAGFKDLLSRLIDPIVDAFTSIYDVTSENAGFLVALAATVGWYVASKVRGLDFVAKAGAVTIFGVAWWYGMIPGSIQALILGVAAITITFKLLRGEITL